MQYISHKKVYEDSVIKGIQMIAKMTEKVYGGEHILVYKNESGKSVVAANYTDALKNGKYKETSAEDVRCVLAEMNWPSDGNKTAILLAAAILKNLQKSNCDEVGFLESINEAITYTIKKIECMACEEDGNLPGGGLWLVTLIRPLRHYAEEKRCIAAGIIAEAMLAPLKALSENSGKAFYEVFERIRSASPNQFYSLHQIGLKNNHIPIHDDKMDVIQFGLEKTSGEIRNLMKMGITEDEETAKKIMEQTKKIIISLGKIRSVWI